MKKELEKNAGVIMVTTSSSTPGKTLNNITTLPEGVPRDQLQSMSTLVVDYDFINTYKLKIAAGRGFSENYGTDSSAFIINETAVKELGWGSPDKAINKGMSGDLEKKARSLGS